MQAFYSRTSAKGRSISRWGGFLDQINLFDPACFGISAREAQFIDPQQRMLLEATYEAFQHAGLAIDRLAGSRTGVFVGISSLDYSHLQQGGESLRGLSPFTAQGCTLSIAANRLSYCWDLRGPSFIVDTACSSTLVAFDRAARSLQSGESDMVVVGGVNAIITPETFVNFSQAQMLSPDGRCRAFDASANGFVRAEGVGAFILKRLDDAIRDGDRILSLVLGTGCNQDGRTSGMAMPSVDAQEALLREVYTNGGIDPAKVRYVEAHGTGTAVGDPCEAESIGRFFGQHRTEDQPLYIGSCKTNVGHLEPASGVASLCKVLLMLQHRQIPPNVHFKLPNPRIPFREYNLRVPISLEPWPDNEPGIVSINSFGFGGANAHVVLGEYRPFEESRFNGNGSTFSKVVLQSAHEKGEVEDRYPISHNGHKSLNADQAWPLVLSARSEESLRRLASAWVELAEKTEGPSLADLTFSAANRRTHYSHRLSLVAADRTDLRDQLQGYLVGEARPYLHSSELHEPVPIAFVFCGQGPQWAHMGRELLDNEPLFGDSMREIDRLLQKVVGWSLIEELSKVEPENLIHLTSYAQPALFALHVSLARLWQSWGIQPAAVVGHSVGEIAAAHIAGILSLEEAVRIIGHRGDCLQSLALPGRMIAAEMTADEARKLLHEFAPTVCVAAINGPRMITLAGQSEAFDVLELQLKARSIWFKPLHVQHAFHSFLVEGAQKPFLERIGAIDRRVPRCDMISTVTAELVGQTGLPSDYWWDNIRQPVRFAEAIWQLADRGISTFIEIGPHPVLASSIRQCRRPEDSPPAIFASLVREKPERRAMLSTLGGMFTIGARIDWRSVWPQGGQVVDLPMHPWSHERFWHESAESQNHRLRPKHHPVLGHEVPGPQRTWENTLDVKIQRWVQDHRVTGRTLVPAAAFVEMLISSSVQLLMSPTVALDEMFIHRGLFISPDAAPSLRTIADASTGTLSIFSRTSDADQNWLQHIQASCRKIPPKLSKSRLDFDAWKDSREGSIEDFYGDYVKVGINFGPTFRNVQELLHRNGSVLGRIELNEELRQEAELFQVHPTLLDGCFQVILELMSRKQRTTRQIYLPERIGRVQFYRSPGFSAWSEVTVSVSTATRLTGSMKIYSADGELAIVISDLDCRAVVGLGLEGDMDNASAWLYRQRWQERPLPEFNVASRPLPQNQPIAELVKSARWKADSVWHDETPETHRTAFALADKLATGYFLKSLRQLGIHLMEETKIHPPSLVQASKLSIAETPLFRRWLNRLVDSGTAVRTDDIWQLVSNLDVPAEGPQWQSILCDFPQFYPWLRLIEIGGRELANQLSGTTRVATSLETDEAVQLLDQIYRDDPRCRAANTFLQKCCQEFAGSLPADRPLRILEVNAGLGSATSYILPGLPSLRTEYWFTDRSPSARSRAEDKFQRHPFVRFHPLDPEMDLASQHIPRRAFDIVVASNFGRDAQSLPTLLKNCSELLADGGLLAVRNMIGAGATHDLLFGSEVVVTEHISSADARTPRTHEWLSLMADSGFVESSVGTGNSDLESFGAVYVGRQPHRPNEGSKAISVGFDQAPPEKNWLIFADHSGIGRALAQRLRQMGRRCIVVEGVRGCEQLEQLSTDEFLLDPASPEGMHTLRASANLENQDLAIIHLWALDSADLVPTLPESVAEVDSCVCHSVMHLIQTWVGAQSTPPRRIILISQGCRDAGAGVTEFGALQGALPGLARVAMNEYPRLPIRLIDLDSEGGTEEQLWGELATGDTNREVIWRHGRRLVPRLASKPNYESTASPQVLPNFGLHVTRPGDMSSLELREIDEADVPGPNQVQIEVEFAALNFRDILKVLGRYPADDPTQLELGDECSGIVRAIGSGVTHVAPGDRVVAVGLGTFRAVVTTKANCVSRVPPRLSLASAVTMPMAYLTAQHALLVKGELAAGDSILIHAAAGGVGMAAMRIASVVGATIYATAGSDAKRDLLKKFGAQAAMNSRTLDFYDELMEATSGRGVDVAMNSLAGQAMSRSLACVAPFGRFVEIGKRDLYENTRVGLFSLRKFVSYHVVDISANAADPIRGKSFALSSVFKEDVPAIPIPFRTIPAGLFEDAFRLMSAGAHVGKLVVDMTQHWDNVHAISRNAVIDPGKSYLITGAFGGVGLEVTRWLADRGARHLVMIGRSGPQSEESKELVAKLRTEGIDVQTAACDVSNRDALSTLMNDVMRRMPPLAGVYHLAMVLDDGVLANLDRARFEKVMAPKSHALWHLHHLTRECPLEQFVVFSSISATLGGLGQANYAAANTAMEALVAYRRSLNLPAVAIGWGMLGEVGYVAQHDEIKKSLSAFGLAPMSVADIRETLDAVIGQSDSARESLTVAAKIDWQVLSKRLHLAEQSPGLLTDLARTADEDNLVSSSLRDSISAASPDERLKQVETFVKSRVARVLGVSPQRIQDGLSLSKMGLDSLMAVELATMIESDLGVSLPLNTLAADMTVTTLVNGLLTELFGIAAEHTTSADIASEPIWTTATAVIQLREGTGASPLFCFPPAGGELRIYDDLLANLPGDSPAFGMKTTDDRAECLFDLAQGYAKAINEAWPDGPVRLFGFSFGGLLAIHTASCLESRGRRVELVGVVECNIIDVESKESREDRLTQLICDGYEEFRKELKFLQEVSPAVLYQEARAVARKLDSQAVVDWVMSKGRDSDKFPRSLVEKYLRRFAKDLIMMISDENKLKTPLRSPLRVWGAADGLGAGFEHWRHQTTGMCCEGILDGDHYSVMHQPLVVALGEALTDACEPQAEQRWSNSIID